MTDMTPVRAARPAGERKLIPLDKLFVSKLNVRKHGPKAVETLAALRARIRLLGSIDHSASESWCDACGC